MTAAKRMKNTLREDGDEIAEYMERINKACAGAPEEIKQKLVRNQADAKNAVRFGGKRNFA